MTVLALDAFLGLPASRGDMLVAAAALPVAAELDDLAKSAIKRSLGVKDFGRILLGHGGMAPSNAEVVATRPYASGIPVSCRMWMSAAWSDSRRSSQMTFASRGQLRVAVGYARSRSRFTAAIPGQRASVEAHSLGAWQPRYVWAKGVGVEG